MKPHQTQVTRRQYENVNGGRSSSAMRAKRSTIEGPRRRLQEKVANR